MRLKFCLTDKTIFFTKETKEGGSEGETREYLLYPERITPGNREYLSGFFITEEDGSRILFPSVDQNDEAALRAGVIINILKNKGAYSESGIAKLIGQMCRQEILKSDEATQAEVDIVYHPEKRPELQKAVMGELQNDKAKVNFLHADREIGGILNEEYPPAKKSEAGDRKAIAPDFLVVADFRSISIFGNLGNGYQKIEGVTLESPLLVTQIGRPTNNDRRGKAEGYIQLFSSTVSSFFEKEEQFPPAFHFSLLPASGLLSETVDCIVEELQMMEEKIRTFSLVETVANPDILEAFKRNILAAKAAGKIMVHRGSHEDLGDMILIREEIQEA